MAYNHCMSKFGSGTNLENINRTLQLFSTNQKRKLFLVAASQFFLNILDLAGVVLLGLLGTVAVTGLGGPANDSKTNSALKFLHIQHLDLQQKVLILGCLATFLLVLKTFASIVLTKKILHFLAARGAEITKKLLTQIMSGDLQNMERKGAQATIFALTQGVGTLVLGIVGTATILTSDLFLLVVLFLGLFLVDPIIASLTFTVFASFGFILYKVMSVKSSKLGIENSALSVASNEMILEALKGFRELRASNRHGLQAERIGNKRAKLAAVSAEISFLPNYSKYLIEIVILTGTLLVAAIEFSLVGATQAVGVLVLFMASAMRIAPAVLRVQQGFLLLKLSGGSAQSTFGLIEELNETEFNVTQPPLHGRIDGFEPIVQVRNLSFAYASSERLTLKNINLEINKGEIVSIVGPSGAGKTTLVDLLLGLHDPHSGEVLISGTAPAIALELWENIVGYVPQESFISNSSLAENVAFGLSKKVIDTQKVNDALKKAQLSEFTATLEDGIWTQLGDHGSKLSGGQRQRVGIARALYSNPQILIMDEPTSALDVTTEQEITQTLESLRGEMTTVIVAHRLSTIKNSDKVIYLDKGRIISVGTFESVRKDIQDFDNQARVLGL